MEHNPFAPPSSSGEAPLDRGLVFSPEGVAVVSSLASWMRAMALMFYLGAGMLCLGVALTFASEVFPPVILIVMSAMIIGLGVAGTWLRSAASGFERGVMSDDEFPIGQGFRALRAYLILFGIVGIFTFLLQAYRLL